MASMSGHAPPLLVQDEGDESEEMVGDEVLMSDVFVGSDMVLNNIVDLCTLLSLQLCSSHRLRIEGMRDRHLGQQHQHQNTLSSPARLHPLPFQRSHASCGLRAAHTQIGIPHTCCLASIVRSGNAVRQILASARRGA